MMVPAITLLLKLLIVLITGLNLVQSQDSSSQCKKQVMEQIISGRLIPDNIVNSGQYLNEIGSYELCKAVTNQTQKYYLEILKVNVDGETKTFVRGNCILKECDASVSRAFDIFVSNNPVSNLINNAQISYIDPEQQYQTIREGYLPGLYVMESIFGMLIVLNSLGMIVQYSSVGNLKVQKNKLQIQFTTDKEGKEHYIELLAQIDKILLNRKKIWAIFFLCFSIPRNTMILFYDTEKNRKVSFMRFLKVIGFIWISFDVTFYVAFFTYPVNFQDYASLTTSPLSVFLMSGIIYGFSLVYFYAGFSVMFDRLQSIYLKKQNYSALLFVFKCYLYYVIPVVYITAIMTQVFPFIGDGPLFPQITTDFFLTNCYSYWWTNVLLINNYVPWSFDSLCGTHLTYIANEFQMIAILIPLFIFIYKHAFRKVLALTFFIVGIGGSIIPIIYMTIAYDVNAYPGLQSHGYDYMLFRIYYRIPPFLLGIALAILQFEYKYVDKLNDGAKPFHKFYLDKIKDKPSFKFICYIVGIIFLILPIIFLLGDVACVDDNPVTNLQYLKLNYCWNTLGSAFYNVFGQIIFFAGLILVLLPCLIHKSEILRPLISSHFWHIMEELTFSAFLLQFLVVTWFFASRDQNILLTMSYLFQVTISSCILSYILAIPFYLLVERPFKNFLELILFPKSSIFKKQKDLEEDDDEESETDEDDKGDGPVSTENRDTTLSALTADKSAINPMSEYKPLKKAKYSSNCGYCQGDASSNLDCQCECLLTKKTCKCVLKIMQREQLRGGSIEYNSKYLSRGLHQRLKCHDNINATTLDASRLSTSKAYDIDRKRVSFDINNLK